MIYYITKSEFSQMYDHCWLKTHYAHSALKKHVTINTDRYIDPSFASSSKLRIKCTEKTIAYFRELNSANGTQGRASSHLRAPHGYTMDTVTLCTVQKRCSVLLQRNVYVHFPI